jgi:ABC-type proline/glycine betaine transport system ATPase subunit
MSHHRFVGKKDRMPLVRLKKHAIVFPGFALMPHRKVKQKIGRSFAVRNTNQRVGSLKQNNKCSG